MNKITKKDICIGLMVDIIQYDDRNNEKIHRGYIKEIITQGKSDKVKVRLENGEAGVVIHIVTQEELKLEAFKFYNKFLYAKEIYAIWHRYEQNYFVHKSREVKILYLFKDKQKAHDFVNHYLNENYMIKSIKKDKKSLNTIFSKTDFDVYYIDNERKISKTKLNQFEDNLKIKS